MSTATLSEQAAALAPMSLFERYLTVWVFVCIVVGIAFGQLLPGPFQAIGLLGWIFIRHVFAPYLPANLLDSDIAGLILLAAAPCAAMVFVWSRLTGSHPVGQVGDAVLTLSQALRYTRSYLTLRHSRSTETL